MKRFAILALALTFLMGAAVTPSFADDAPAPTKKKKKGKKTDSRPKLVSSSTER